MRQLNTFEQRILQRIIEYHNKGVLSNVASIFTAHLDNTNLVLDYDKASIEIQVDFDFYTQGQLVEKVRQLTIETVVAVNLLKELQANSYVILLLESDLEKKMTFGNLIVDKPHIDANIYDKDIIKSLLDYSFKTILVQQPLINYVSNGFRTQEERTKRFEIRFAIAVLLISTVLSGIEIYHHSKEVDYLKQAVEQEQTIKLNDKQIKSLEDKIESNKVILEQGNNILNDIKNLETEKKKTLRKKKVKRDN